MIISVTVLSVVCFLTTGAVLAAGMVLMSRTGPIGPAVQYAAVAGVAEVGAATMYLIWINTDGVAAFAMANALMVLGPVALPLTFHALHRSALNLWCSVVAMGSVAVVALASLLLPVPGALAVRIGAFAVVCLCAAMAALASPQSRRPSIRLLAVMVGAYALYSAMRLVAVVAVGWQAVMDDGPFSDAGAVVVGVVGVVGAGFAVVWFWVGLQQDARRALGATMAVRLVVGDGRWPSLMHGGLRIRELVGDVHDAAREIDPRAMVVDDGVGLSDPDMASRLLQKLRGEYNWTNDEFDLLDVPAVRSRRTSRPTAARGRPV